MEKPTEISKALTWEELARIYDKTTGKKARIQPMGDISDWAVSRSELFYIDPVEDTIHSIIKP